MPAAAGARLASEQEQAQVLQAWALELRPGAEQQAWARAAAGARPASEQAQVRVQPVWVLEPGLQERPVSERARVLRAWEQELLRLGAERQAWVRPAEVVRPVSERAQEQEQPVWALEPGPQELPAWAQQAAERPASERARALRVLALLELRPGAELPAWARPAEVRPVSEQVPARARLVWAQEPGLQERPAWAQELLGPLVWLQERQVLLV